MYSQNHVAIFHARRGLLNKNQGLLFGCFKKGTIE